MSAFSSKRGIYIYIYIYIYHNLKTDLKITYITTKDLIFLYKMAILNTTICTFVQCSGQNNKERAKEIFVGIQLIFKVFCAYSYIYSIAR